MILIIEANFSHSEIYVKVVQDIWGGAIVREIIDFGGAIVACSRSTVVTVFGYLIFVITVDIIDDFLVIKPLKVLFLVD